MKGSQEAAAVIGQFDGRAAAAAEQPLVLPLHARSAGQLLGIVVLGLRPRFALGGPVRPAAVGGGSAGPR